MLWTLLLVLTGCQYFEEVRTPPTVVTWDGYVLAQVADEADARVLDDGSLSLTAMDGSFALDATASTSTAGYWRFEEVPVGVEVALRIEGPEGGSDTLPEMTPTVWRGVTPSGRASWLTGGLFARDLATTDSFLEGLETYDDIDTVTPLSDGSTSLLWGEPWEPEAWIGAELRIVDGQGLASTPLTFTYAEDGSLIRATDDDPVDLFLGVDLDPGDISLEVTSASGATTTTTWPAEGGDMLSAIYMSLPAAESAP